LLSPYVRGSQFFRPRPDVSLIGPNNQITTTSAQIDTGADFNVFASLLAPSLGLTLPATRQFGISGAGGGYTSSLSFPPDGVVSLFLTDYQEFVTFPPL
jgi:hypothetical protein